MTEKIIVSTALTGSWGTKEQNPYIPYTPEEIAEDAYACYKAGAAIVHLHMRNDKGNPVIDKNLFKKTMALIKEKCDVVINITSSGQSGDDFGTDIDALRIAPILALKPEIASFDCGSLNWRHEYIFDNSPKFLEKLGRAMLESGTKPEIEIFDGGMVYEALYLRKIGVLQDPMHFQFVLGAGGGLMASVENLMFMKSLIPEGSTWSATGIGKSYVQIMLATLALGGHIRVGLEDCLNFDKGVPATNKMLTDRAVALIKLMGYEVATPDEARELLSIRKK